MLITRQKSPENRESPFHQLSGFLTPTNDFYIRSHFPTPVIDIDSWRLTIGSVHLTFAELSKLPAVTIASTMECAGNGRVFLEPKTTGVQWEWGAVGTAEWTGVRLSTLLDLAHADGVDVVLEGADKGTVDEPHKSPGEIYYSRSIPMAVARRDDVIVATHMNGKPLTPAHGYPARAVVPGWYGAASTKWLTRILVLDRPFQGFFQTGDYTFFEQSGDRPWEMRMLTTMPLKSQIARPAVGDAVAAGSVVTVTGAAWAGEGSVAAVHLSDDGGKTWLGPATWTTPPVPRAWRLWSIDWTAPARPGPAALMSRATADDGRTQPMHRPPGRGGYLVDHCIPVEITVEDQTEIR